MTSTDQNEPSRLDSGRAAETASGESPLKEDEVVRYAPQTSTVFISHDSRDRPLAEAFGALLRRVSAGLLQPFISSQRGEEFGIPFGSDWYDAIMSGIGRSSDVVCLLTPFSLNRPWILFEAGVAHAKLGTPVFGVALGVDMDDASSGPFLRFQNCGSDAEQLTELLVQLLKRLSATPDKKALEWAVALFRSELDQQKGVWGSEGVIPITKSPREDALTPRQFEEVKRIIERVADSTSNSPPAWGRTLAGESSVDSTETITIEVSFTEDGHSMAITPAGPFSSWITKWSEHLYKSTYETAGDLFSHIMALLSHGLLFEELPKIRDLFAGLEREFALIGARPPIDPVVGLRSQALREQIRRIESSVLRYPGHETHVRLSCPG